MRYAASFLPTEGFPTMAFDTLTPTVAPLSAAALIDGCEAPRADWARANPDRALAVLFVAPQDCDAVDVLTAH